MMNRYVGLKIWLRVSLPMRDGKKKNEDAFFVHLLYIQFVHPCFISVPLKSNTRRIFVFSHAPPNGSGIRIIQENHVVNGCCWLNHSDEKNCRKFIEIVREHRCIKVSVNNCLYHTSFHLCNSILKLNTPFSTIHTHDDGAYLQGWFSGHFHLGQDYQGKKKDLFHTCMFLNLTSAKSLLI